MTKLRGEIKKTRRRLPIVLAGLALFFQSAPAWSLTLPEAVELAIRTYPEVLAAERNTKSLEQKLRKEFAGYLPTMDLSAGYGRENSDNSTTRAADPNQHDMTLSRGETGITMSQMVFDGFDVRYTVARAEADLKKAQAEWRSSTDNTALRAVQSYVDVVIRHAQLALVKDNVLLHQRILAKVRKKFEGGAGNQADVHQAQSRTYLSSASHASSRAAYQASQAKFTEIIGQEPPEGMTRPEAPERFLPESLEMALEVALKSNPRLEGVRFDLEAAEATLKAANAPFWPKVDMELGATSNANMGGSEGHSQSASAMLRMRYNLYQGGADVAGLRGARSEKEKKQQIFDKEQRVLVEQIRELWSKLTTTRDRVGFLKKHVAVSRQVTASYHDQFKMGKRTLLDVLNSENELFSAKNAKLFEELTYIKTSYEMLANMGTLRQAFSSEPDGSSSEESSEESTEEDVPESTTQPESSQEPGNGVDAALLEVLIDSFPAG